MEAEQILSLMLLENKEDSNISYMLGKVYFAMNRYEDAISSYLQVQAGEKRYAKSIANRALAIAMSSHFQ